MLITYKNLCSSRPATRLNDPSVPARAGEVGQEPFASPRTTKSPGQATSFWRGRVRLCGGLLILLILFPSWCYASTQAKVAVIFSSDIEPYQQSWNGFKDYFREKKVTLIVSEYHLERQMPDLIIQQIAREKPDLILTIGPQSTMLAKKKIKKIPVIFSMILDYREIDNPNFTGVFLDVPSRIKLEYIKRILPDVKRIGVIYSSKSIPVFREILLGCNEMEYQLISRKVNSGKDFKNTFKDISPQIDSFLIVPDTKIYFNQSIKYLLLEGIRRKVPVIGLSSAYTRAGAFASLESDYYESGRQAGEIALRVNEGEKPYNITPAAPGRTKLSLNLLVAERLGITIPSDIIEESSEVFGK